MNACMTTSYKVAGGQAVGLPGQTSLTLFVHVPTIVLPQYHLFTKKWHSFSRCVARRRVLWKHIFSVKTSAITYLDEMDLFLLIRAFPSWFEANNSNLYTSDSTKLTVLCLGHFLVN